MNGIHGVSLGQGSQFQKDCKNAIDVLADYINNNKDKFPSIFNPQPPRYITAKFFDSEEWLVVQEDNSFPIKRDLDEQEAKELVKKLNNNEITVEELKPFCIIEHQMISIPIDINNTKGVQS